MLLESQNDINITRSASQHGHFVTDQSLEQISTCPAYQVEMMAQLNTTLVLVSKRI